MAWNPGRVPWPGLLALLLYDGAWAQTRPATPEELEQVEGREREPVRLRPRPRRVERGTVVRRCALDLSGGRSDTSFAESAVPGKRGEARADTFQTPLGPMELEYELVDGLMVMEGDIVLHHDAPEPGVEPAAVGLTNWQMLWPKAFIPFMVDDDVDVFDVMDAITEWEKKTKFRFGYIVQPKPGQSYLRFVDTGPFASAAEIGRRAGGESRVWVGDGVSVGNIVHEIGHAVGLFHEMARADRDTYVVIHWGNIQSGEDGNFKKYINHPMYTYGQSGAYQTGSYDYDSIMHYGSWAFARVNWAKVVFSGLLALPLGGFDASGYAVGPTITRNLTDPANWYNIENKKKGIPGDEYIRGKRSTLSAGDLAHIAKLYSWTCGGLLSWTPNPKKIGTNYFKGHKLDIANCRDEDYTFATSDYMDLELSVTSTNKVEIPAQDFRVELASTDENGWAATFHGKNDNPYSIGLRDGQKSKVSLLPVYANQGHVLSFTNWLHDRVKADVDFQLTPTPMKPDAYEPNDVLTQASEVKNAIYTNFLLTGGIQNVSLHTSADKDYYKFKLPEPPSYYNLEKICHPTKPVTSEQGAKVKPGVLTVSVARQDPGRTLKALVHRRKKDGTYEALAPAAYHWLDPVSCKKTAKGDCQNQDRRILCPYTVFEDGYLYLSVEDLNKQRNLYEIWIHLSLTREDLPPKENIWKQERLPEARRGPWPDLMEDPGRFIGNLGMERIISQGPDLIRFLGEDFFRKQAENQPGPRVKSPRRLQTTPGRQ